MRQTQARSALLLTTPLLLTTLAAAQIALPAPDDSSFALPVPFSGLTPPQPALEPFPVSPPYPQPTTLADDLPDAPTPNIDLPPTDPPASSSTSVFDPTPAAFFASSTSTTNPSTLVALKDCPYDRTHARECRLHIRDLTISAFAYLAFQDVGNLYTGYWYRYETSTGEWFDRWIASAAGWRWTRWTDGNPFLDDYIGHSMMGAITNFLWIQNDPKGMTLAQSNTREYWKSRLRATAFSTAFSFQWKLGPLGEAGIGHNGDHYFYENNGDPNQTNETGWVELVTTPVGGLLWNLAEDRLDESVIARLEQKSRNPLALIGYQFLNPARATANFFRFRAPWYRDTREVWATPLFHHPTPEDDLPPSAPSSSSAAFADTPTTGYVIRRNLPPPTHLPPFGGNGEFGTMIGFSAQSDTFLGSSEDTRYLPMVLRYSTLLLASANDRVALRYSPELNALVMLDEPTGLTGIENARRRTYGTGVSPEGFQLVLRPTRRVQPFLSNNAGLIYFYKPLLLTPNGTSVLYTADLGVGLNIFRTARQSLTIGYRFQHFGPLDPGLQSYGTDANLFYFAISRFYTSSKGRQF